jgi:hypothetical protein
MIKKYEDFIKESHSKTVKLNSEDVSLFTSEPLLQKLVADKKVSLFGDEVKYDESDIQTKEVLDQYLEIAGKVEESWNVYESKKPTKSSSFDEKHDWLYKNVPEYKKVCDETIDKFLKEMKEKEKGNEKN